MLVAQRAQTGEEAVGRRHTIHVARHRLDDHRRDLWPPLRESLAHGGQIVVAQGQRLRRQRRRDPRGGRHTQRQGARTGLDQQAVGMAVIAAFELHDPVAPRGAARQTDGTHGGLGAGVDEAHLLDRRHELAHPPRELRFQCRRRAEAEPPGRHLLHRADHLGVRMPDDHRPPGADVIDVAPPRRVHHVGTLRPIDENRDPAHAAKGAHRRIHTAGNIALRFFEQGFGTGHDQAPVEKDAASAAVNRWA